MRDRATLLDGDIWINNFRWFRAKITQKEYSLPPAPARRSVTDANEK